ncbi:MAG: DUF4340 domain-containing protein [Methylothermaceae bacterium]|nr:DUF4340 domain-containing protein [Methylothermaceae bacterium]
MSKRWWSIGILLALVIVLGGWVYWLGRTPAPQPSSPLAQIAPDAVQYILVERPGERLEFSRQGEADWRMTRPLDAPSDAYHMEQLLSLPSRSSEKRYGVAEQDLERFGLKPPQARVCLKKTVDAPDCAAELLFGHQNPLNSQRYIQVGDGLHLVTDDLFHQLTAPAATWVEHKLLSDDTIRSLDLPGWHIALEEEGKWTSDPELPADRLEGLVSAWRNARAIQVTSFDGEAPLRAQRIQIKLEDETVAFVILQRKPELVLLRPDLKLQYHFYGSVGENLLSPEPAPPPAAPTVP